MEEQRVTRAGALTRYDIGRIVGVTTDSGAYVRDRLAGLIYGCDVPGHRPREVAVSSADAPPTVLLRFDNAAPIDHRNSFDAPSSYFKVDTESAADLESRAREQAESLAQRLAEAGIPVRDIGTMLGVSFQRAHQLVNAN